MTELLTRTDSLTAIEQQELTTCETTIERGLQTYFEVGTALQSIRDNRLYRATYGTFEEYCQQRWGMTKSRANQLVSAAEVAANLTTMVVKLPTNERQTRPLVGLTPEQQRAAYQEAVETAENGKVTAEHIQHVVSQHKARVGSFDPDGVLDEAPPADSVGRQKPKINRAADEYVPQGFDACQTPPYALTALLPYLSGIKAHWTIWEPACGEGLLVESLVANGFRNLLPTDLMTGDNFFQLQPDHWDCIVTNPPYSLKYEWLERCYHLNKPFALLLPVETLGASTGQALFREYGVEVIFMDARVDFKMPEIGWGNDEKRSTAQFPTAWFTSGLYIGQQMTFARIKEAKRKFVEGLRL